MLSLLPLSNAVFTNDSEFSTFLINSANSLSAIHPQAPSEQMTALSHLSTFSNMGLEACPPPLNADVMFFMGCVLISYSSISPFL